MIDIRQYGCGCTSYLSHIARCQLHGGAEEMYADWCEVRDIIDDSMLTEAGRYQQIVAVFELRQRARISRIDNPAQPDVGRPTPEESKPSPLTAKRTK